MFTHSSTCIKPAQPLTCFHLGLQDSGVATEYVSDPYDEDDGWSNLHDPWSYPSGNILIDGEDPVGHEHEQRLGVSGEDKTAPAETGLPANAPSRGVPPTPKAANLFCPMIEVGVEPLGGCVE